MDYFIMHQDARVTNAAKLLPTSLDLYTLTREQINAIPSTRILHVRENRYNEYPDYLEREGMLVSEKLKQIMSKYQQNAIFKTIVLIEKTKNR